jgi:hypothetical protein
MLQVSEAILKSDAVAGSATLICPVVIPPEFPTVIVVGALVCPGTATSDTLVGVALSLARVRTVAVIATALVTPSWVTEMESPLGVPAVAMLKSTTTVHV